VGLYNRFQLPLESMSNRIFASYRRASSPAEPQSHLRVAGVRSRLLIWYFLLTFCITLSSVWATFKIFCAQEEQQAGARLQRDVEALQQQITQQNSAQLTPQDLATTVKQFTASQASDPNQTLLLLWNGQLYTNPSAQLPVLLKHNPDQVQQWVQSTTSSQPFVREGYLIRVVRPLQMNGQPGAIVGLYDATLRYR
jgi:hypothetical protein